MSINLIREKIMEKGKQLNLSDLIKQLEIALKQQGATQLTANKMTYESSNQLGKVIKTARNDQDLSQKKLAALSGLSTLTITKLENGNRRVSLENIEKVLSALGKSLWIH